MCHVKERVLWRMGSCLSLNHCLLPLTLIVLGIHGTVRDREGEGAWNGWRMKVTRVQPILTSVPLGPFPSFQHSRSVTSHSFFSRVLNDMKEVKRPNERRTRVVNDRSWRVRRPWSLPTGEFPWLPSDSHVRHGRLAHDGGDAKK